MGEVPLCRRESNARSDARRPAPLFPRGIEARAQGPSQLVRPVEARRDGRERLSGGPEAGFRSGRNRGRHEGHDAGGRVLEGAELLHYAGTSQEVDKRQPFAESAAALRLFVEATNGSTRCQFL